MFVSGRFTSKRLIWLTAFAMPFQSGWVSNCACSSAIQLTEATSSTTTLACCCCQPRTSKPGRCLADGTSQPTCCSRGTEPDRKVGCQCGPTCQCVDRKDAPNRPAAPAPNNGRSQSVVELAVLLSNIHIPAGKNRSIVSVADSDSAFCQPGALVCVLLCRFTL